MLRCFFIRCVAAFILIVGVAFGTVADAVEVNSSHASRLSSYTWWDRSLDKEAPPRPENLDWEYWSYRERVLSSRYEDRYTPLHRKIYDKDPWVWGYIGPFAERFHMPEKWIEPELEGALGVAFRMMFPLTVQCGFGGDPKNCSAPPRCQLDVYYDATINLPWVHDDQMRDNLMEGMHSGMFLHDPEYQFRSTNQYYRKRSDPYGVPQPGPLASPMVFQLDGQEMRGTIAHFDREYMPGVGLISWLGLCPSTPTPATATLTFPDATGAPRHVMRLPGSWIKRAHQKWLAQKDEQNIPLLASVLEKVEGRLDSPWQKTKNWWQRHNPFVEPKPAPLPVDSSAYERTFVQGDGKNPFTADPFTWVYTREFAERFRMPGKWIDPELKGALAIAFRTVDLYSMACGLGGNPDMCRPPTTCQMDIYYDNAIPLPSDHAFVRDNVETEFHSGRFLHHQTFRSKGVNRYIYDQIDLDDETPRKDPSYNIMGSRGNFFLYDRAYRSGIGLISWVSACPRHFPPRPARFVNGDDWEAHGYGKLKEENIRVLHEIVYPNDFWKRAQAVYNVGYSAVNQAFHEVTSKFFRRGGR